MALAVRRSQVHKFTSALHQADWGGKYGDCLNFNICTVLVWSYLISLVSSTTKLGSARQFNGYKSEYFKKKFAVNNTLTAMWNCHQNLTFGQFYVLKLKLFSFKSNIQNTMCVPLDTLVSILHKICFCKKIWFYSLMLSQYKTVICAVYGFTFGTKI